MSLVRRSVPYVHSLKVKPLKYSPDIRVIVDAHHHLPSATSHELGHPLVVFEGEIHTIACGLPVRRVHVMEGVRPVVAFGAFKPAQVLDVGTRQPLPGRRQVLLDPQQVDGWASGGGTEGLPTDLAGEGMVLQVEKSGSPLDIGEGFRPGHLLPFEHLTGAERPLELAYELFQVVLHNPVQRHQIAVDIVEDFNGCRLGPHEVKRGTTGKNLDVAFMGWEQWN